MRQALICGMLLTWLCACETFPQLDAVITDEAKNADYPKLIPSGELRTSGDSGRLTEQNDDDLEARAQRLRERGDTLRKLIREDS